MVLSRFSALSGILLLFLHDQFLEKSPTETPDVNNHILTHAADKYRFHYDKTTKNCGPLLLQDIARKQKTIQTKQRCLSSSLSLSVGFSIQDEAMDVARSAPQGAHYYHADVIYLLP